MARGLRTRRAPRKCRVGDGHDRVLIYIHCIPGLQHRKSFLHTTRTVDIDEGGQGAPPPPRKAKGLVTPLSPPTAFPQATDQQQQSRRQIETGGRWADGAQM